MKITVLSENTSVSEALGCEHGLSLLLETKSHTVLFDTGASGLFAENAAKLGIDLGSVDIAVISHGHYDHGGGLRTFLDINEKARVYFHEGAFASHYSNRPDGVKADIGLDRSLLPNDRFVFCGDSCRIDEELELFSGVEQLRFVPSGNRDLFAKDGDEYIPDDFSHEQNLIVLSGGQAIVIASCAHNGIVSILDTYAARKRSYPDNVISGFHLYNPAAKKDEDPDLVDRIGEVLKKTEASFYTCHCTGLPSYNRLKAILGNRIEYIGAGKQFEINI